MTRNRWLIVVSVAVALAGAACGGGSGGKSSGQGNLSVSVGSGATTPTMGGSLDLGNGILVNEIRVAIVKVALESGQDGGDASDTSSGAHGAATVADHGGGDGGGDGGGGGGENDEVKVGPCLIDLAGDKLTAGDNSLTPVCASDIPAGTFQELEVDIGPVAAADAGAVAGLAALNGESIVVDGTFDGTAFTFQSTLDVRQRTETTITVDSSNNVTIMLDPSGWFTAPGGGVLDPSAAASQAAIEDNIRASIRSFEDDNRDGHDDGDHGGGGGGGGMSGGM